MLYDLSLFSNEEIAQLYEKESARYLDAINKGVAYNTLHEIYLSVKAIARELDKRTRPGPLKS